MTDAAVAVPDSPRTWKWGSLEVLVLFAVIGCAVYAPSFSAPFIFDDDRTISLNPNVRHLWPADWLTKETRPVGMLTFAVNHQLSGLNLAALHATNTAIHIVAAWVLFLLVRGVAGSRGNSALSAAGAQSVALIAALLWLVHPLNTQAVSYLSQRFESLMGLLFLACLYGLWRGATSEKQSAAWYVFALAAGWLSMGCKEVAATLVIVAPLFDRAYLAESWRETIRRRGWVYAALVPAAALLIYIHRRTDGSAGFGLESITPWEYLRSQPSILLHYLGTALLPLRLIFDYAWPVENDPLRIYGAGLVVVVLLAGAVVFYRRKPQWGFLGLAFFLILGPTSSFMPIADLAVEHRMYLSSAILCIIVVLMTWSWIERAQWTPEKQRQVGLVAACIAVSLLSWRTFQRNEDYRRPLRLYAQCVGFNAKNRRANNNVAVLLQAQGRLEDARRFYQAAIDADPRHAYAYKQLGMLEVQDVKLTAGAARFREAMQADPRDAMAPYFLGLTLGRLGEDRDAADAFRGCLKLAPTFAPGMRELAWTLATTADDEVRDGEAALRWAEKSLKLRPGDPRTLSALAAAYAETGRWDEAVEAADQALEAAEKLGRTDLIDFEQRSAAFRRSEPYRRPFGPEVHDAGREALE